MGYSLNHGILYLVEIYTAVVNCESIRDSAMILLMLSSNMNSDSLSVLKVDDFLDACSDYLDDKNDIDELLNLNPWDIVPCWRDVANQKFLSFNTPEATFHILLYLKKRKESGEKLKYESPLFIGHKSSPIKSKSIRNRFANVKCNFHVDFTQTSLLKTFEFVCENYCDNEDLVKLLLMKDVETNPLYGKTSSEVRTYYKPLIPFLTARLFDGQNEVVNDIVNNDAIILNYYNEYIKHRNVEYSYKEELKIKKRAKKIKNEIFKDVFVLNNQQLDIVYKYAECEYLILKKPYLDECESSDKRIVDGSSHGDENNCEWIWNCFKELGIIDILEVSEAKTKREIIKQSVEKDVSLNTLTYCGLLKIFDGLLEAILLDK